MTCKNDAVKTQSNR